MDITGIAIKLDSWSALSPLASCYVDLVQLISNRKFSLLHIYVSIVWVDDVMNTILLLWNIVRSTTV